MTAPQEGDFTANLLAIVVTYDPGDDLPRNLEALSTQAQVIVIDNGSSNAASVEAAARATGCRLILNGENRGVAAALNQAVEIAVSEGFEWLATFDHDSLVPEGALANVLRSYARHPESEKIAIISMSRRDRGTGYDYTPAWAILQDAPEWRSVRTTITSGSIVKIDIIHIAGRFDEGLFVDSVDHDFALRCRRHGYLVIEDKTSVMQHSIGNSTSHRLLGKEIIAGHHSATRQYYIVRNVLEVMSRSLSIDLMWSGRTFAYTLLSIFAVLLYERDKGAKLLAMVEGARDFMLRRFGRRPSRRKRGRVTQRPQNQSIP